MRRARARACCCTTTSSTSSLPTCAPRGRSRALHFVHIPWRRAGLARAAHRGCIGRVPSPATWWGCTSRGTTEFSRPQHAARHDGRLAALERPPEGDAPGVPTGRRGGVRRPGLVAGSPAAEQIPVDERPERPSRALQRTDPSKNIVRGLSWRRPAPRGAASGGRASRPARSLAARGARVRRPSRGHASARAVGERRASPTPQSTCEFTIISRPSLPTGNTTCSWSTRLRMG